MTKKWRVTGRDQKEFQTLAEARKYRKTLAASLPEDTVISIERLETGYDKDSSDYRWIPTNH